MENTQCLMCFGCIGHHVMVDVTEPDDITKRHSNVFTVWQTSAILVTTLLKIHVQK